MDTVVVCYRAVHYLLLHPPYFKRENTTNDTFTQSSSCSLLAGCGWGRLVGWGGPGSKVTAVTSVLATILSFHNQRARGVVSGDDCGGFPVVSLGQLDTYTLTNLEWL